MNRPSIAKVVVVEIDGMFSREVVKWFPVVNGQRLTDQSFTTKREAYLVAETLR